MNEFYLPNIGYNNRRDTQKLYLAYTKDTLNNIIIILIIVVVVLLRNSIMVIVEI